MFLYEYFLIVMFKARRISEIRVTGFCVRSNDKIINEGWEYGILLRNYQANLEKYIILHTILILLYNRH